MKEILKIRCQIYFLMKKVIILKKIHVTMKSFAPPFFNYFSLSLKGEKRVVMRAMRKKLNICGSTADLLFVIGIGNFDWGVRESSHHTAFMGIWSTISQTC